MSFILALDQGTSSSRSIIFDDEAQQVASASEEFEQIFPQPGWVEHDPEAIWHSQLQTAHQAMRVARLTAADLAAIGITNQRETTMIWERATGRPVYNAIVWQDRRTAAFCEDLRAAGNEPAIRERTGLVLDPYFSATKIRWILDQVPDAGNRAAKGELAFGTVDSWLIWQLTRGRVHVTDRTNASRTMLFNLETNDWDKDLLDIVEIPRAILPEVAASASNFGHTDERVLGAAVPVSGVAGDQQAALFGQACFAAGEAKNTYGTGSFSLMHTGDARPRSTALLATAAASPDGGRAFALEGSIFVTGSAVQWLRDGLGIIKSASDIEALAGSVPDSGGVVVVPAFTGLGAPHWDPQARGTILGLTRGTSAAHIARATLEAIALQVCEVIDSMEVDSGVVLTELRVDGGAAANDLLMQIQADMLGKPVVRPVALEATARGAAYLAGLTAGVWNGADELRSKWSVDRRFEPQMSERTRRGMIAMWRRAVERARNWAIGE
ncbi:MAG TPA: glycerol kinase GlpK [Dehalococcoidia bacterium]|nr:glycerol kinase GlpK [Dehalococcoidia bacterium]